MKTSRNALKTVKGSVNSSKKVKILWIHPFSLDGELHKTDFLEILKALAKRKHEVSLIAIGSKRFQLNNHSKIKIFTIPLKIFPVISPLFFAISLCLLLPVYIIKCKPDFIVSRPDVSILSSIFSLLLCKLKKVRLVLDIRSTPVETKGLRGFLQTMWFVPSVRIANSFFDGLTIVTPLMKEEIRERFKINRYKIGVWMNGVDTAAFNPKNMINERVKLRKELGLTRKFVIFYHGIMTATRGLSETIEAIEKLQDTKDEIVLFLLGTGPIVSNLEKLVSEKKLSNRVIIHDAVPHNQVPKYIAMCDVCIVPLPNHPFWNFQCPLKLLEYLAMEKPIIATDIPAHRLIAGQKDLIYISSVTPDEIANAILISYCNRTKFKKLGENGRDIIIKNFEWKDIANDLERYLFSLDRNNHS